MGCEEEGRAAMLTKCGHRRLQCGTYGVEGRRAVSGSESPAGVEGNELVVVGAEVGPDVGVETVCSEADDVRLKDRQACAIKLTAVC